MTFKHSFVTPSSWGLKSLFLLFLPKFIAMRDTVHETDKTSLKFQECGHSLESASDFIILGPISITEYSPSVIAVSSVIPAWNSYSLASV